MQCKYHPDKPAEIFCASCNAPLCKECAEEAKPGQYYCFECAMLHSVSEVGTSMREKREKGEEKKEKKKWGPFHYFVIVCSVLILVMWGIIIFGGQKAPPRMVDFAKKGRVLLFMVDGALKRYAHYEGNRYPERLSKLVPKYLSLRKEELFNLDRLSYQRDPKGGYSLSLAKTKPGEMNVILSAKGIEYSRPPSSGGRE
jgi:hypothetical protein